MASWQIPVLVHILVLFSVPRSLVAVDRGPCYNIQRFFTITESDPPGTVLFNWTRDDVIATTFQFNNRLYANYLNVSDDSLYLIKEMDLENGDFQKNTFKCDYWCKDSTFLPPDMPTLGFAFNIHVRPINEFDPEFHPQNFSASVRELTSVGTVVFTIPVRNVTDGDLNGRIAKFALEGTDGAFGLADTTKGTIVINRELDYDAGTKSYELKLLAVDDGASVAGGIDRTGTGTLVINVEDVDDQSPAFISGHYTLTIKEEDPGSVNTPLSTTPPLQAFDQDLGLNYSVSYQLLPDSDLYSAFTVDSVTGAITLHHTLDRESVSQPISLHIKAYENSIIQRWNTTSVSVILNDTDDNFPEFTSDSYSTEIDEHAAPGTFVVLVSATDKDQGPNAAFTYKLLNGTEYFRVRGDQTGPGMIVVENGTALDRETNPELWIRVGTSTDVGQTNTAIVKVTLRDINDNTPTFGDKVYDFEIRRDTQSQNGSSGALVGDVLGTVSATDKDDGVNGQITYSFGSPGIEDYLSIGDISGDVSIIRTPLPLEGQTPSMDFFVKATDSGNPSLESVALVKVTQYGDDVSSYLYADVSSSLLIRDKLPLERNISEILGVSVEVKEIVPDNAASVDLSRSRIRLIATYSNGTNVTRQALQRLTVHHSPEIQALFDAYKHTATPVVRKEKVITPAEIALIVICCVVFIVTILVILAFIFMNRKLKRLARLDKNLRRPSNIYETQELKMDVMAESSDVDKSVSSDDEDDLIRSVEDGNPDTRWNPIFTDGDDVTNISEVTELKKYHTYPPVRSSDDNDMDGEAGLSDAGAGSVGRETSTDSVNEDANSEDGQPTDGLSTVTAETVVPAEADQLDDDAEVVSLDSEQMTEPEPSIVGSPPPSFGTGLVPVPPPLPTNFTDSEPTIAPPSPTSTENVNPIEDYDMDTETGSLPESAPPSMVSEPNPDYNHLSPEPPEPKPDYAKVSFSDTAIAIDPDNKVEVIKQELDDDDVEQPDNDDQGNGDETDNEHAAQEDIDDDDSLDGVNPAEDGDTRNYINISSLETSDKSPLIHSSDEGLVEETPSSSDSHSVDVWKTDEPVYSVPKKDYGAKPKAISQTGFVNPAFTKDTTPKNNEAEDSNDFNFSEALTRL